MIICICSSVIICCLICGCIIFKKYKKHKEEIQYPNDLNTNAQQIFNTGNNLHLRPFQNIPSYSNRESTMYIHPFNYVYPSNYPYDLQDHTADKIIELQENPEKISRQLTFNTPVKTKRIYSDEPHINLSSARINYPKSEMTCKYVRKYPQENYSGFNHNLYNKNNPQIEAQESYVISDVEREFRLNEDYIVDSKDMHRYYVNNSPLRKFSTNNSHVFNNEYNCSPIKRRTITDYTNDSHNLNNNYDLRVNRSGKLNTDFDERYINSVNRTRSKIIKTPIKSFLRKRYNY